MHKSNAVKCTMAFSNPFSKLFAEIENAKIQPVWLVLTLVSVVLVRIILEWTLEVQRTIENQQSLLLFFLYFSSVLCVLAILLWVFSGRPMESVLKIVAAFSPVLWIPPFVDFILSFGKGFELLFMFNPNGFVDGLATFCSHCSGVSLGLQMEVALACLVAGAYVWHACRDVLKAAFLAIIFYFFVLIQAFLPGFYMAFFGHVFTDVYLFRELVSTYALLIGTAILVGFWAIQSPQKFHGFRLERAFHYVGLTVMGAIIGSVAWTHSGWGRVLPLASLALSVFFVFAAAVWFNDYFDRRYLNPKRNANDLLPWTQVVLFSTAGFLCAWAAGYVAALLVGLALALSVVYSAPPLRLRQHVVTASLVLAGCSLAVFLAGFSLGLAQPETGINTPLAAQWSAIVFGFVLLASSFKDLKDAALDRKSGVFTLASWLGPQRARWIVAALVVLAVLWATVLSGLAVWLGWLMAAGAGFVIIKSASWKILERWIFALDYAFMGLLVLHFLGWIAGL